MNPEVSYTQDLSPDDSNHDLDAPKCGLWKWWSFGSRYLSLSLEMEDKVSLKVMETLGLMGYLWGSPTKLKWPEPTKACVDPPFCPLDTYQD